MNKIKLSRINYILTEECNLKCSFCFQNKVKESNNQLTEKEILDFTKFIINNYEIDEKYLNITIIGGEPMLFKDFTILNKVINLFSQNHINIKDISIFSNFLYLNNTFIDFISYIYNKKYTIDIISSSNVDDEFPNRIFGIENISKYNKNLQKIHDMFPNIKIKRTGLFDSSIKEHYEEILNKKFQGINSNYFSFAEYYSESNNLTEQDFYLFTKIFFKLIKKYNVDYLDNCVLDNFADISGLKFILKIINFYNNKEYKSKCMPFIKEIGISPQGFITPCSRSLCFKKDFVNINNKTENEIIKQLSLYRNNNNVNIQSKTEDSFDCEDCFFHDNCVSCKFLPHKYIEYNGVFYIPKEKCKYELDQFNGQYRGIKEFFIQEGIINE